MAMVQTNNYEMVKEAITGSRPVNDQTFAALDNLSDILARLKGMNPAFAQVEFSPTVQQLHATAAL